jgi:hypothetical protein
MEGNGKLKKLLLPRLAWTQRKANMMLAEKHLEAKRNDRKTGGALMAQRWRAQVAD